MDSISLSAVLSPDTSGGCVALCPGLDVASQGEFIDEAMLNLFRRVHFNADPAVIDKTVTVSGRPLEVIGVAPGQAFESLPIDLYAPLHLARRVDFQSGRKERKDRKRA